MNMRRHDEKRKQRHKLGRLLMDSDSLDEHFDGRPLAFMKTLRRRLMEVMSGHTDDMYIHVNGHVLTIPPPFPLLWSCGEFLFTEIGRRCLPSQCTRSTSLA